MREEIPAPVTGAGLMLTSSFSKANENAESRYTGMLLLASRSDLRESQKKT